MILCIAFVLFNVKKSQHKTKRFIYTGGVYFPIIIAAIFLMIGRWGLFLISVFISFVIGLIMLPFSQSIRREEATMGDISGPIQFKDFFSSRLLFKLERKYDELKALAIYIITLIGCAGFGIAIAYWALLDVISEFNINVWPMFVAAFVAVVLVSVIMSTPSFLAV
jgi:EamA domain-containing membrane protein RarD